MSDYHSFRPLSDSDKPLFNARFSPRGQYAIPVSNINDSPVRCFRVNNQWLAHIIGVLDALDQPDSWLGTETEIDNARSQIRSLIASFENGDCGMTDYAGKIEMCAIETLPVGRLWCDGSTHNRVDYPTLYDSLPSAFIVDTDTFVTPDMREKMPLGKGGTLGINDNGGEREHTLTVDEMPSHVHGYPKTGDRPLIYDPNVGATINLVSGGSLPTRASQAQDVTTAAGTGLAHNNMPPYTVCNFVICTGE